MPRYVDADAFKHELCIRQHMLNADSLWKTLEIMDAQPTADVAKRKKGKWIKIKRNDVRGVYVGCSECGCPIPTDSQLDFIDKSEALFCYQCGAEMKGDKQ